MTRYRIAHITDLLKVPPEHWDECMRDLRGAMISLHLVQTMAALDPAANFDPMKDCPFIDFEPDGKGEITPMMNGKALFSMKVTRDEAKP